MEFEQRLIEIMELKGISTNELAEKTGVTRQQIARWKKGTSEAGAHKIKKICEVYGISADYLLGLPEGLEYPKKEDRERPTNNCTK